MTLAEFRGACGGMIAIEPNEVMYVHEVELLGAQVVNVKLKNGKSFLLNEKYEDVISDLELYSN